MTIDNKIRYEQLKSTPSVILSGDVTGSGTMASDGHIHIATDIVAGGSGILYHDRNITMRVTNAYVEDFFDYSPYFPNGFVLANYNALFSGSVWDAYNTEASGHNIVMGFKLISLVSDLGPGNDTGAHSATLIHQASLVNKTIRWRMDAPSQYATGTTLNFDLRVYGW